MQNVHKRRWRYLKILSELTRKSSCVNARGIPTAVCQVLHLLSCTRWAPPQGTPPPARYDRGYPRPGLTGVGVPEVWYPQPGLMGGVPEVGYPPDQVQQGVPKVEYPPPAGPGWGTPPPPPTWTWAGVPPPPRCGQMDG